jgi:hypothetical protein
MNVHEDDALIWGLEGRNPEFTIYDISQVLEATNNFSESNKLGQGGFGPVYKVHMNTPVLKEKKKQNFSFTYHSNYAVKSSSRLIFLQQNISQVSLTIGSKRVPGPIS